MDWSFLRHSKKIIYLLQNITVLIFLQITEQLMEPIFICQCNVYSMCFVIMYFIIPAAAFSAFACSLQQGNIFTVHSSCLKWFKKPNGSNGFKCCSCRCKDICGFFLSLFKTLYPALCWVVILLIDGKYLACGLYSKCDSNMSTVNTKDLEMVQGMVVSKVCGLGVVAVFALLYFICPYLVCCCRSDADRYEEMYMSQLEEDREEFARTYAEMCSKNRAKQCKGKLRNELGSPFHTQKIVEIIREEFNSPQHLPTHRDGYQNMTSPDTEMENFPT